MIRVTFHPFEEQVEVPVGTTVLAASRQAGVEIEAPCNGAGHCGKCRVIVPVEQLPHLETFGHDLLTPADLAAGVVLACHAHLRGDLDVYLPERSEEGLKIVTGGRSAAVAVDPFIRKHFDGEWTTVLGGDQVIAREDGDTTGEGYGVVVDIGTTTLVVSLVDLSTGAAEISLSALNPQSIHAQDVLSRIRFAGDPGGLHLMTSLLLDELNRLIAEAAATRKIDPMRIYEVIFSGNTCMLHLAIGVDPSPLGKYPFVPSVTGSNHVPARDLGLGVADGALVYLPPVISAYVGADITAGILAADLAHLPGTTLFIDIGTNGEMVLARDGRLAATSTAAGPAFEGMNISFGMRAAAGAVERFEIVEGDAVVATIADAEPVGICGSGLLDVVGEVVAHGVVGANGRFADPKATDLPEQLRTRLEKVEGKTVFRVAGGVTLSQKDVRQVQLAKGAIRAGIEFLLRSQEVAVEEVDRVYIAGSFGYHVSERSLINIGLLPAEWQGRVEFLGNTSRVGGEMLLLNRHLRQTLQDLVPEVEVVELTGYEDFDRVFMTAIGFG